MAPEAPGRRLSGKTAVEPPTITEEEQKRKDQANMLTSLGKVTPTDPDFKDKRAALQLYKSMARFAPEKTAILQKWKNDKTCKWHNDFRAERIATSSASTRRVADFGTM